MYIIIYYFTVILFLIKFNYLIIESSRFKPVLISKLLTKIKVGHGVVAA